MLNPHSYNIALSYYTFGVLITGGIATLYSPKIGSTMKLIALLGLLNFNITATHFSFYPEVLRIFAITPHFLRLIRILLLCWLTWGILSFSGDLLQVQWRRLRRLTMGYSLLASIIYLASFFLFPVGMEILEIGIYLILACYSIGLPILCINLGIRNTMGQSPIRYWYRDISSTMLFCALLQVMTFIPLYLTYFPSALNLKHYAETNVLYNTGPSNFFAIYFFFFSLPFLGHCLYILKTSNSSVLSSPDIGSLMEEQSIEELQAFATHYGVSKRELEVLQKLLLGYSYAAIGEQLFISPATVKSHIYSVYRKTRVKNKIQLLSKILNP